DFTLKATLPPCSGKGAVISISVIPGYQSGQRLASLKRAIVSWGEAFIRTSCCTTAIVDLLARSLSPYTTSHLLARASTRGTGAACTRRMGGSRPPWRHPHLGRRPGRPRN